MSTTSQQHTELWDACRQFIKDNLTAAQFDTWFRDMTSVSFADGVLKLLVPSVFFIEQIQARYLNVLRAGIKKVYGPGVHLEFLYPIKQGDPQSMSFQKGAEPSPAIMQQSTAPAANPFREPCSAAATSTRSSMPDTLSRTTVLAKATRLPAR